jgi:hypothetical protein
VVCVIAVSRLTSTPNDSVRGWCRPSQASTGCWSADIWALEERALLPGADAIAIEILIRPSYRKLLRAVVLETTDGPDQALTKAAHSPNLRNGLHRERLRARRAGVWVRPRLPF